MDSKDLNKALVQSLKSEHLLNIGEDISEALIDRVLDDGLLKDIPLIGTAINLVKTGISIRERFFLKKILKFLFQLKDIPISDRLSFLDNFKENPQLINEVGEKILFHVDMVDELDKAKLLGILYKKFLALEIDRDQFNKLTTAIELMRLYDLCELKKLHSGEKIEGSINNAGLQRLVICGLAKYQFANGMVFGYAGNIVITEIGKIFIEKVLPENF